MHNSPLYAAIDGKLAAIIAVADPVKPTTPAAIAALRRKVAWRILPPAIILYLVAYLDRANVGDAGARTDARARGARTCPRS